MVLGLFGRLVFLCAEGHVLTPHAFSREVSARWARHDILGAMPVHEWTGENPDEISLDIMLNASLGVPPDTALAVLRCALCEILYMDDIPNAAAINEAIELAKGYDAPDTVSFINGVLGGFMRGEQEEQAKSE